MNTNKLFARLLVVSTLFCCSISATFAQQRVKKVVVQAFWWDYWNNNFRFKWADYLTELAPRLKALGVDAIWVPPNIKNDGPGSVGYMPFDHYDLGDKNQKGETLSDTVRTRSGNKDELLRMIAVMHANGIEVIQDIVLNHSGGAGNRGGNAAGGRDYNASSAPYTDATNGMSGTNYYKNFRFSCFATPFLDTSAADYWTRSGRWSKNLTNFYPNPNNNTVNTTDINKVYFGPDMAYENTSIGRSFTIPTSGTVTINGITKSYYNPNQSSNYMAQNAKDWIVWYKKQTGCDGFRWDAVKHFGFDVQRDLTYALKYQSGFANGGNSMFNVGEWVGAATDVDYYSNNMIKLGTPTESGVTNEQMSGGFDFGLRGYGSTSGDNQGIYTMVLGQGNFDMQILPSKQQQKRYFDYPNGTRVYKTVPFVNSHDTYRPLPTTTGNYNGPLGSSAGWDVGQELGGNGQHIDPREPRFAAANAVIAAVDGNPCFFMEDVFDYYSVNKRWSHLPSNSDSLPLRKDVGNIMQAHQALKFKDGDYAVPTAATGTNAPVIPANGGSLTDHLVIERTGKALIGISDAYSSVANNSADQQVWVTADNAWPVNTILYDYSGAHGVAGTQIYTDHRVLIKTAPCGHTIAGAYGHGYSIWAPYPNGTPATVQDLYNYLASTYSQPRAITTTQEWEMADDLGDSHCASLGQGGQLPANSTNQRVAGKIYVQSGTTVTYKLFPAIDNTNINIALWDLEGNKLSEVEGNSTAISPITNTYTATTTGWITIKVRNANTSQPAQKVWANVTYTAPTTLNTRDSLNWNRTRVSIWTGNAGTTDINDCGNWEEGKVPNNNSIVVVPKYGLPRPAFPNGFAGKIIAPTLTKGVFKNVNSAMVKINNYSSVDTTYSITNGTYLANSVVPINSTIKPYKNNDVAKANGVNSVDALLVQRHILNTTKLNNAYKLIAADVDGNKTINSVDVLRIKRLILGTDTTFKNTQTSENRLWAFVDSAFVFADTTNPFPFKDSITANTDLNTIKPNQTFIGVKLGDVNFDWNSATAKPLAVNNVELTANSEKATDNKSTINYKFSTLNPELLSALQTTLHFDNTQYEFVSINNNKFDIDFNTAQANKTGNISLVWIDKKGEAKTFKAGDELFSLQLRQRLMVNGQQMTDNRLPFADLQLNDEVTSTAAFDETLNKKGVVLRTKEIVTNDLTISPNPAHTQFTIYCEKIADKAQIIITNAAGKQVYQSTINSKQLTIDCSQFAKGFYMVSVITANTKSIQKLVIE